MTVRAVTPKSTAAAAGIRAGDVITAIGGKKVQDFDALLTILQTFRIGDKIPFTILQYNAADKRESIDIDVTLLGWPD